MSGDAVNRLVTYLDDRAGEYLRGAIQYTDDDYRVLFLRSDVEADYSERNLEEFCEYWRVREDGSEGAPFSLGNVHCTVRFYDEALLFHFAQGEDVGTVVTLDPEAGRDIVTFITHCLELLHRDSPQTIEHVPTWLQE